MFNSGIRGRRARDIEGTLNPQIKYVQAVYPIPTISGYTLVGVDDTALNTAGGQTVIVTGTNFSTGVSATLSGVQIGAVTLLSSTQISFTTPALSAGTYALIVYNSAGGAAILLPGMIYSGFPTYLTNSGSIGSFYETNSISTSVSAPSDSAVTYTLVSGSLPTGATLNSNGTITGTAPLDASGTTYTFSIKATDAELQDITRTFTITINTDVVTWATPSNGATITLDGTAYTQALSATSAAGKTVSYTADTLPTGLTLTSGVISGTPTVTQTLASVLTGTAATSTRTKTNSITWVVNVGDLFFKYTTLLLNGSTTNNLFLNDASTNNNQLTINGDAKATTYSPYTGNYNSVYFPATGNYITAVNAIHNISAVNVVWTYESWIMPLTAGYFFAIGNGASYGNSMTVAWNAATANKFRVLCGNGSSNPVSFESTNTYTAGIWYHVAVTRTSSGIYTLYVNGLADGTQTYIAGTLAAGTTLVINGAYDNNGLGNAGCAFYLSNMRFVVGTVVYTGSFTPPTSPLSVITNTVLLTCQSNLFSDNSGYNQTLTRNNTLTLISPANPFGKQSSMSVVNTGYSFYLNGSTDYFTVPDSTAFTMGAGDFTIECWVFLTGVAQQVFIGTCDAAGSQGSMSFILGLNGTAFPFVAVGYAGSMSFSTFGTTLKIGQWYHIAGVRNGATVNVYVNGVKGPDLNMAALAITDSSQVVGIGRNGAGNFEYTNGFISNVRIVKGQALYTAAFTPSTSPLTTTSQGISTGTVSLLTCQSPAQGSSIIDASPTPSVITQGGSPKILNNTYPFAQTTATVSNLATLGSAYYDGTGDYVTASTNPGFAFGATNDFTAECWVYFTTLNASQSPGIISVANSGSSTGWQIYADSNNGWGVRSNAANVFTVTRPPTVGQWYHVAYVRKSGVHALYVNGLLNTPTSSSSYTWSDQVFYSGYTPIGNTVYGFVADVRLVNGTALYTGNFAPTYQPLPAVANTQLLTCQFNGGGNNIGIIDNSNLNNTITRYGNTAQGSFSPYSRTGWSTYFDGSTSVAPSSIFNTVLPGLANNKVQIECWIYPTGATFATGFFFLGTYAAVAQNGRWAFGANGSGYLYFDWTISTSSSANTTSTLQIVANVWQHIAVTIDATTPANATVQIYYNGTPATVSTGNNMSTQTANYTVPQISLSYTYASMFTGFISNLRVLKNNFTYTAAFGSNLPTAPFIPTPDTVLLCLQSNRLIDNAPNPSTLTVPNGTPVIHAFSPFGSIREATPLSYSTYFGGATTDFLTVTTSAGQHNLPGDFTVEFWFFDMGTTKTLQQFAYSSTGGFACGINGFDGNATRKLDWRVVGSAPIYGITAISSYRWHHAAYVKSGSTFRIYLNGLLDYYNASYTNTFTSTLTYIGAANNADANYSFNGYISNFRVIKTAIYTSTNTTLGLSGFTVPTTQLGITQSSSTGIAAINAIVANGNSVYLNGTSDYLTVANSLGFVLGTNDFTVETWIFLTSGGTGGNITLASFNYDNSVPSGNWGFYLNGTSPNWTLYFNSAAANHSSTTTAIIALNTWTHVAYTRTYGTTTGRFFVNGTLLGTTITDNTNYSGSTGLLYIGRMSAAAFYLPGFMSNLRIVNGVALYTGTFAIPTSPLSLTQSAGTNITALTGVPSNGNSVYFDGTGDYLDTVAISGLGFGTGDWEMSFWYSIISASGYVFDMRTGSANAPFLYIDSGSYSWGTNATVAITGTEKPKNVWHYVTISKLSGSTRLFVDGTQVGSTYTDANNYGTTGTLRLGCRFTTITDIPFNGYISNLKVIKGTGVSSQTVPTVPSTVTANTSLLICQGTSFVDNSVNNFAITPTGDVRVNRAWSPFGYTPQLLIGQATTLVDNSNNNFIITAVGTAFANKTVSPFGFSPQLLTCQSAISIIDNSNNSLAITGTATTRVLPYNPYGYTNNSASLYIPSIHGGSAFHDGSGDYSSMPSNQLFNLSGVDFTVECWAYVTAAGNNNIITLGTGGVATHWGLGINSSNQVTFSVNTGQNWNWTNDVTTAGTAIQLNTWTHIACVRNGSGVFNIYFNGVRQYNTASFVNPVGSSGTLFVGTYYANYNNDGSFFRGYISDLRITRSALYTTNFFPPLTALTNQITTVNQPALLLSFTNAGITDQHGTNILESLSNTGLSPEDPLLGNYYSNFFDGTGDYLQVPFSANTSLGAGGNWTLELWINMPAVPTAAVSVIGASNGGGNVNKWFINVNMDTAFAYGANKIGLHTNIGGVDRWINVTYTWSAGVWYHIAAVYDSTNTTLYVNGSSVGTMAYNVSTSTNGIRIGSDGEAYKYFTGYISNVRIVRTQLYSGATLTVPTVPLTAVANTSLLTCQSNQLKDNSSSPATLTRNGDTVVRSYNPFQRNTGRSISFPTTSSYLSIADNQNIRLGTGDLTIECWFYLIGNSTDGASLFSYTNGTAYGIILHTNLTAHPTKLTLWIDTYGTGPYITGTTLVPGQWNFFVLTRASGVWKMWLNGAQDGSNYTNAATPDRGAGYNLRIGGDGIRNLNGYVKDFRITKGYARYTSAGSNPTLPFSGL